MKMFILTGDNRIILTMLINKCFNKRKGSKIKSYY